MAKNKKRNKKKQPIIDNEISIYIYSLLIITFSIIGWLEVGIVGEFLTQGIQYLVGNMYGIFYMTLILIAFIFMKDKTLKQVKERYIIGFILLFCAWLILCATPSDEKLIGMDVFHYYTEHTAAIISHQLSFGGGIVGALLFSISSLFFDRAGTFIIVGLLIILALLLIVSKDTMVKTRNKLMKTKDNIDEYIEIKKEAKERKQNVEKYEKQDSEMIRKLSFIDYDDVEKEYKDGEEYGEATSLFLNTDLILQKEEDVLKARKQEVNEKEQEEIEKKTTSKYITDFKNYKLPSIRLLNLPDKKTKSGTNVSAANESGKQLIAILEQFGVNATLVDTHIGPSVTKFELKPENGVRVNKISNLQQDIKMGLAAKDIRIEAPIPGKSTVGIEIPNKEKTIVNMRDIMKAIPSDYEHRKLLFALGKDLMGNPVYGELNKMPHLLIAGATGSGKSVCVNSIITSILMRTKPDEVKMLLIDPKKVEFTQYSKIPHLLAPVITSGEEASRALKVIVKMMEDRYDLFSKVGVRNIGSYNIYLENHPEENVSKMPYIMVVIDELADLMLVAAKEVESSIQRITQLARAAGIHLIVATQRPSVDVITGVIKANIPSRIAFAVSSAVDSRTILDQQGAEKLLGYGDMLYVPVGEQVAIRVQGCYVSDEEVSAICDYCSAQALPRYEDIFINLSEIDSQGGAVNDVNDPLYEEVKEFVLEAQKASTSFIQRKFSIGYSRAARLIDTLEANGIIGPSRGSKPREVYGPRDKE